MASKPMRDELSYPRDRVLLFACPTSQAECPSHPPERVEPESPCVGGGPLSLRPWKEGDTTTPGILCYPRTNASWILMEA